MIFQTPLSNPSDALSWLYEQALVMVGKLGLREEVIPSRHSHMHGTLSGEAITLHTHRFMGSVFRSLSLAYIRTQHTRQLCSLTLIGLPTAKSLLPIVAMELRALSGTLSLLAVDLFPTDERVYLAQAVPILQTLRERSALCSVPRKRSALGHSATSPLALLCAAVPQQEGQLMQAVAHFLQQVTALAELSHNSCSDPERSDLAWQAQCAWLRCEHTNQKESSAMSLMFGEAATQRYLQDVLFQAPHSQESGPTRQ